MLALRNFEREFQWKKTFTPAEWKSEFEKLVSEETARIKKEVDGKA